MYLEPSCLLNSTRRAGKMIRARNARAIQRLKDQAPVSLPNFMWCFSFAGRAVADVTDGQKERNNTYNNAQTNARLSVDRHDNKPKRAFLTV